MKFSTIVRDGPDGPRPRPVAVVPADEVVIELCTAEHRRLESEGASADAAVRLSMATFPPRPADGIAGRPGFLERVGAAIAALDGEGGSKDRRATVTLPMRKDAGPSTASSNDGG